MALRELRGCRDSGVNMHKYEEWSPIYTALGYFLVHTCIVACMAP